MARDGERTRQEAIEAQLPMVRQVAGRFARRGEDFEDLVQVGTVALICAVDRYRVDRGTSLRAYAEPCVEGAIRRYLRDRACPVREPRQVQLHRAKVARAEREAAQTEGCSPSVEVIAARAGLDVDTVRRVGGPFMGSLRHGLTIDPAVVEPLAGDELAGVEDRLTVAAALRRLPGRERRLIEARFYADRTQAEIAAEMGISQVQVSRLLRRALERMRGELDERVVVRGASRA